MTNKRQYFIWNGSLLVVIVSLMLALDSFLPLILVFVLYRQYNPGVEYRGADYDDQGRPYPKGF